MLLIITSTGDKLFIGVNVDKIKVLVIFFAIFGCDTHFKSVLHRNGWRWTWTTCVWYFSIERTFLKILSFDVLNSRSLPYGGLKFKYSLKMR